jgi:hypothetical protein
MSLTRLMCSVSITSKYLRFVFEQLKYFLTHLDIVLNRELIIILLYILEVFLFVLI